MATRYTFTFIQLTIVVSTVIVPDIGSCADEMMNVA